jgi:hypothetical protein
MSVDGLSTAEQCSLSACGMSDIGSKPFPECLQALPALSSRFLKVIEELLTSNYWSSRPRNLTTISCSSKQFLHMMCISNTHNTQTVHF